MLNQNMDCLNLKEHHEKDCEPVKGKFVMKIFFQIIFNI